MKRLMVALATLLALTAPAAFAAAATAQGPAWWTVSNGGGSTLHIMAVPDGMLVNTDWNPAELERRAGLARLMVVPLLGAPLNGWRDVPSREKAQRDWCVPPLFTARELGKEEEEEEVERTLPAYSLDTRRGGVAGQAPPSQCLWVRGLGLEGRTFDDPMAKRLPPAVNSRYERALGNVLGNLLTGMRNAKTWEATLWLDVWNWPPGLLGNPATDKALALSGAGALVAARKVRLETVQVPALWKPFLPDGALAPLASRETLIADQEALRLLVPNNRTPPPEAVQQKCLLQVLEQTESGQMPAARAAAMQAWARGDVKNALKRSNDVQYCLMGDQPSTDAQSYLKRSAYTYIQSLDLAFDEPGDTVALVEFDPLLLQSGGVLDYYRRLGYEIAEPAGAR